MSDQQNDWFAKAISQSEEFPCVLDKNSFREIFFWHNKLGITNFKLGITKTFIVL